MTTRRERAERRITETLREAYNDHAAEAIASEAFDACEAELAADLQSDETIERAEFARRSASPDGRPYPAMRAALNAALEEGQRNG